MYLLDIFLVLSNLVFFIPAKRSVQLYRWTRAAIYFLIVFASGTYHTCRSYNNLCIFTFRLHHNLDFFFAELIIPLSALYLINFKRGYEWVERWLIIAFAILIFVLQVYTNGALYIQMIIVGISITFIISYWVIFYDDKHNYNYVMLGRGINVTILSVALFAVQGRYMRGYWLVHSIWHILGALGQDYILRAKTPRPGDKYASLDSKMSYTLFKPVIRLIN